MRDPAREARIRLGVLRVGGVHVAPQHVGVLVGGGDVEVEQAGVEARPLVLEQLHPLGEDQLGLAHVLLVVEHVVVERLGVGRQPLGPEGPDVAHDLGAEVGGVGDRPGLVGGVDVDRRDVQLEVRPYLLDQESDDAGHLADHRQQVERHLDPRRVLAPLEQQRPALDVEPHHVVAVGVQVDRERRLGRVGVGIPRGLLGGA
jgi:hypothetical protein